MEHKQSKYEAVIGLEVHIQLNTKSKAFCGDRAGYSTIPNSQVSAISLAHPGTLPRINQAQVDAAIRLGLALGCEINQRTYFDRKHYFYADLPKGFQTTQDSEPICLGGEVPFVFQGRIKTCAIHHIHMEEDAGKSIHDLDDKFSYIDLNRAGVPLLELVTQPDLHDAEEVFHFIHALRKLVRFIDISDGNMEEGSMRCDCNVSIRERGFQGLNARCEVKNINSARYARKAVQFEIDRQIELYEAGKTVSQDTREFLPDQGITRSLRGKEDAHDYRYFPEPDLPPVLISKELIQQIQSELPTLPILYYKRFVNEYGLDQADAVSLIDSRETAEYFEKVLAEQPSIQPSEWAKLYINRIKPHLEEHELQPGDFPVGSRQLADFLAILHGGEVVKSTVNQQLWPVLLAKPQDVGELVKKLGLDEKTDDHTLKQVVSEVIRSNPQQVDKFRKGKKAVIGFFMGQVMRQTKGKSDPDQVRKELESALLQDGSD